MIKKVAMKGFKSYGNKRVSIPLHKGFTCVVGPNGSGKSNLFDAISFVLGRMSAKALRAGSISGLVFAGSEKQKPAKGAEVNIYFSNADKAFPIDKEEIIISRSVDMSGKGVYRVNNKRETRTYVIDILNHVGLTPDGYNMIAQGDINRFIEMSSFERRSIIEEISGIQEYDDRKEKGLRELEKADENIARMDLVIKEVGSQLNRLENEKNDALRYQYLKDEISKHKGFLVYGELDERTQEQLQTCSDIAEKGGEIFRLEGELGAMEAEILEKEQRLCDVELDIESKREDEYMELTRTIAGLSSRHESLRTKKEMNEDSKRDMDATATQNRGTISEQEAEIESLSKTLGRKQQELVTLDETVLAKEGAYNAIIASLEKTSSTFFSYKQDADDLEERISTLKGGELRQQTACTKLEERITSTGERIESLAERLDSLGLGDVEASLSEAEGEMAGILSRQKELDVAAMRSQEAELSRHIDAIEKRLISLRRSATEFQSRVGRKQESRDLHGKNASATDSILRLRDMDEIPGIVGKFSDLGTTRKEYAVALEVAAGARMKDIVVEDSDVARACVSYLKRHQLGRVTFIPLLDITSRFNPGRYARNLSREGSIDFAINLVSFNEEYRTAFEFVFSNTLIIGSIDDSKGMDRQRMVTLDGDIVEASGIITGGYWRPRAYLESFETREDEEEIARLGREIASFESQASSKKEELRSVRASIAEVSTEETRLSTQYAALERKQRDLLRQKGELERRSSQLTMEHEEAGRLHDGMRSSLESQRDALAAIREEIGELEREKDDIDMKVEESRPEGIEHSQELGQELSRLRAEQEALRTACHTLLSHIESYSSDNARLESENETIASRSAALWEQITSVASELSSLDEELEEKRETEAEMSRMLREVKGERDRLRSALGTLRTKRERASSRTHALQSDIKVLEVKLATANERIAELEVEAAAYERPTELPSDLKELRFRISRMEKEKDGLEPINMRAIDEFDEVETRYLILTSKREKLQEEKDSILTFIDEIEQKKKSIFMQAFDIVKENFTEVFAQLSPEGEGNLVLEDGDDPFCGGLFIEARPAGKELNRTESMSGGEKALTALAFVFAIQLYKPAPFYILDEIDAHLDDDNVKRISELIKNSSHASQFIVITHRDVMMTTADRLFGTSLGKDKISKVVSVELEKVQDLEGTDRYGVVESQA